MRFTCLIVVKPVPEALAAARNLAALIYQQRNLIILPNCIVSSRPHYCFSFLNRFNGWCTYIHTYVCVYVSIFGGVLEFYSLEPHCRPLKKPMVSGFANWNQTARKMWANTEKESVISEHSIKYHYPFIQPTIFIHLNKKRLVWFYQSIYTFLFFWILHWQQWQPTLNRMEGKAKNPTLSSYYLSYCIHNKWWICKVRNLFGRLVL